ncbi:SatD family protein [Luteipulveratus halotolerans]|uniref:Sigma-70 region 4 type 2 n=1 Tax=Luteipulveratus halotolerans TaxID=1631356 RepID=A0A0L6CGY6_9MICO|nr:SatD family protein [Luteipulveratus halotolerans]KNX36778.1 sigma-70 region 4 type 2 [Luteipulveratus halotolerans]
MAEVKHPAQEATLIGDLVRSRASADRAALHRRLVAALSDLEIDGTIEPAAVTFADELQGRYTTVGAAVHAALLIRLALLPEADVRFGIGRGTVTTLDTDRRTQDGPGWWSARAAIEATEAGERRAGLRLVRTTYSPYDDDPAAPAVNAALACRDHLMGSLDERSLRILRGLMTGQTKTALADAEGISASAVSQRAVRDGLDTIVLASDWLRQVR